MSWTDERVTLLKKLWGEGKTAAEIAKELGGVTRNAVIGKAHRLKLSGRVSPIQQNKKPANKSVAPKPKPKVQAKAVQLNDEKRDKTKLSDLKAGQCRWPIGDPRNDDFGFCGDKGIDGLPYCMEHAQIAYQAATRNKILQSQKKKTVETVTAEEMAIAKKAVNQ